MDITEAKQLIEEEKKERAAICEKELLQVIEKHNCIFQIDLKLNGNQILPNLLIIAK
jgi:hypothetical protein